MLLTMKKKVLLYRSNEKAIVQSQLNVGKLHACERKLNQQDKRLKKVKRLILRYNLVRLHHQFIRD